eukprot:327107_1
MGGLSGGAMLLRHLRAGVLAERSVCDVRNQHQRSQRVFKPVFQPENCAYRAGLYGGGSSAVDTPAPGLYSKAVALCCLFCPALWLDSASDRHEYVYQKQAV